MLKSLSFFLRFYLFWLLFFFIDRAVFLIIYQERLKSFPATQTLSTFYHALPLDLSMTAYLAIIPLFYYLFWLFNGKKMVNMKWVSVYNTILIVLFSLISTFNFNIYREWGTKLNAKAIGFLFTSPGEMLASSESSPIGKSLLTLFFLLIAGFLLQRWIVTKKLSFTNTPLWLKGIVCILLLGCNFLLIRGGIDVSPINQSMAYFSDEPLLNHAAVNTEWNLLSSILKSVKEGSNHYNYLPPETAKQEVKELYTVTKDTTISILNTKRPNVVLIIMESFTADLTKTLGNMDGVTPKFDSLVHQGVLFTNIYATGTRTDKGIIGTLAGFPSLAAGNMVHYPERMQKIPSISGELVKNGYATAFFYGGESEFDNYKAFILTHKYQKLIDKNHFKKSEMNSKWGAFDGVVLNRQLKELSKEKQPFFSTQMTLTNHEPFEVPGAYKFGSADNVEKFKSTAFYTDSCINDFLNKAKALPWYKNTLFIFVADHGHILPKQTNEVYVPQRYHIPLLFYGDVIKEEYRGKTFDKVGSQIDVASTLLHQLGLNTKLFVWSKNLLNPYTKPFAFYSWDNGMGFITDIQCVSFDNVGKRVLFNNHKDHTEHTLKTLKQGQSYLQEVYQQFLEL